MCTSRPTGLCVTRGGVWHDDCISFLCRGGLAEMGWSGLERGVRCVVVGHAAAPRLRCHFHRRMCVCTVNNISDAGATALAEALKINNTVQTVYLFSMSCVCSWCCVVLEAAPLRAHLFWTVDGGSAHGPEVFAGGVAGPAEGGGAQDTHRRGGVLWRTQGAANREEPLADAQTKKQMYETSMPTCGTYQAERGGCKARAGGSQPTRPPTGGCMTTHTETPPPRHQSPPKKGFLTNTRG